MDLITYSILKKQVDGVASGVESVDVSGTDLNFKFKDGASATMTFPEPTNGKDLEFNWDGTKLGVRQQGQTEYQYVDLAGKAGKDGVAGKNGTDGKDGASAYDVAVSEGFTGNESEWLASLKGENGSNGKDGTNGKDGVDGQSAYQLAVSKGFTGTEEEWLVSLKGTDGKEGAQGKAGNDGITPHIGDNGNWFIGDTDTGIAASGKTDIDDTQTTAENTWSAQKISETLSNFSPTTAPVPSLCDYIAVDTWNFSKDGTTYEEVTIPHTCNNVDGYSSSMYKGTTHYKTKLVIPKINKDKDYVLVFRAVGQRSTVAVNGVEVYHSMSGYVPFQIDITDYIHQGVNDVEVVCDNTDTSEYIPVSADFNFNNGLHEMVYLYSIDKISLDCTTYGVDRMHVSHTGSVGGSATVKVEYGIDNRSDTDMNITATIKVDDEVVVENQVLSTSYKSTTQTAEFTIDSPILWNGIQNPYLYNITVVLSVAGILIDTQTVRYGIRYFDYDTENGFMLNGMVYRLRGTAMHQDAPDKASAMTTEDFDKDFEIIKELGCNFLRIAHYTHDKYVFDKCDELGIIVQTEIPWVNHLGKNATQTYHDSIEWSLKHMINNYFNHPSIVFWGLSNELNGSHWSGGGDPQGGYSASLMVEWTNEFVAMAKSLDSSRLVGITSHDSTYSGVTPSALNIDYMANNEYKGWYGSSTKFEDFGSNMDIYRDKFSGKPVGVGEYGAGNNPATHSENPTSTTNIGSGGARHDEEYANLFHESYLEQIIARPWLLYTSIWILFDFAVAARKEGGTNYINDKGIVTRDRTTKKDVFYLYKAAWSDEKVTYITSRRFTTRSTDDIKIKVYSNARILKLYRDGELIESMNSMIRSDSIRCGVIWEFPTVKFTAESHEFKVVGEYSDGRPVEDIVTFSTEAEINPETYDDRYNYIQMTEAPAAINTGYIPKANTKVEAKFFLPDTSSLNTIPFGSRTSGSATNRYMAYINMDNALANFGIGNYSLNNASITKPDDCIYNIMMSKDGCSLNGAELPLTGDGDFTFTDSTLSMYIMGCNQAGSAIMTCVAGSRLYYFKIFEDEVLIHEFVPSLSDTGHIVLKDLVNPTAEPIAVEETKYIASAVDDICALESSVLNLEDAEGSVTIPLNASGTCTVINDSDWVTATLADDNTSLTLDYTANTTSTERTAEIRVICGLAVSVLTIYQSTGVLPYSEELEFVAASDTNSYFLTDIIENTENLSIEVKGSMSGGSGALFGSRMATNVSRIDFMRGGNDNDFLFSNVDVYKRSCSFSTGSGNSDELVHTFVCDYAKQLVVDNVAYPVENTIGTFTMGVPLAILGDNTNGTVNNANGTRTLYYIKLTSNGTLIHHLIPVKDNDGTVCLYDNITGKFYYGGENSTFTYSSLSN